MSSIKRALSGDVLVLDLQEERNETLATAERGGRHARTLLKSGPLRVTQVVIAPGGEVAEHQADGAITVQPLEGRLHFTANGEVHDLGPGQLLSAAPGVRHSVSSTGGSTFLLTVVQAGPSSHREPAAPSAAPVGAGQTTTAQEPEAWLRGPLEGVPKLLMPAAHALVQAREDLRHAAAELSVAELWARPGGAASIGFHLQHIVGSLDRLYTYARGGSLSPEQLAAIKREGESATPPATAAELLEGVDRAVESALRALAATPEATLLDAREVGRARLPSNVLGLLFHAAEHTQRHTGQVIATARILRASA